MDTTLARQDSFMISSGCKKMGLLELIYTVNHNLVKMLNEQEPVLIPECCVHYPEEKDKSTQIYCLDKEQVKDKTKLLLKESLALQEVLPATDLTETTVYLNLKRLVADQIKTIDQGPTVKEAKEIAADSLQNPSEPPRPPTARKEARKAPVML